MFRFPDFFFKSIKLKKRSAEKFSNVNTAFQIYLSVFGKKMPSYLQSPVSQFKYFALAQTFLIGGK